MSRTADRVFGVGLWLTTALAASIAVLIFLFVFRESQPALADVGLVRFFGDSLWLPTENFFGLTPMLVGTVLVTLGAVVLATPIGVSSALLARFIAPPRVAAAYLRVLELMAGIPSVVYGLWGLVVLVPLVGRLSPPGSGLFTGIVILTIMILPTLALTTHSRLSSIPREYLTAAKALGLSRATTVLRVVLPSSRSGLVAAVVLATGRAIGETMAMLMVCGNVVQIPDQFFKPIRTLTANIALEMGYAMDAHRSALFVSGLMLMAMVIGLVMLANFTRDDAHA